MLDDQGARSLPTLEMTFQQRLGSMGRQFSIDDEMNLPDDSPALRLNGAP